MALRGDLTTALRALPAPRSIAGWRASCVAEREATRPGYDAPGSGVYAPALIRQLCELLPEGAVVTCDVGQHQMWVAQHGLFSRPRTHLSSGGLGAMGFGVPAAIGAAFARPDRVVVAVSGDGSFLMNVQELATIARYQVPVKILIIDNQRLGMVRQWQSLFFEGRHSEVDLSDNPDFCEVARAFRVPALVLERRSRQTATLRAWLDTPGPALLHVRIDPLANVWPLVPPNASNSDMLDADGEDADGHAE